MPFKSQAQRAYMFIHHPAIAHRWAKEYPNQHHLPEHVDNPTEHAKTLFKSDKSHIYRQWDGNNHVDVKR